MIVQQHYLSDGTNVTIIVAGAEGDPIVFPWSLVTPARCHAYGFAGTSAEGLREATNALERLKANPPPAGSQRGIYEKLLLDRRWRDGS